MSISNPPPFLPPYPLYTPPPYSSQEVASSSSKECPLSLLKEGNRPTSDTSENNMKMKKMPYRNRCWRCRRTREVSIEVNDAKHPRCHFCRWVRCPECNACKEGCNRPMAK
jgi:hypothetical protein